MGEPGCDVRLAVCSDSPAPDPETPRVLAALDAAGIRAEMRGWDEPGVDWAASRAVVIRSTWNYTRKLPAFLAWCDEVSRASVLWNPARVVRWNADKAYLLELAAAGLPAVPSEHIARGGQARLAEIGRSRGWERVVVKPAVSLGALGAARFDAGAAEGQAHLEGLLATGPVVVQPFVPSLADAGELSLIAIDGAVSHAVRKIPAAGDFRVHVQYGGREERAAVSPQCAALAERVIGHVDAPLLYARVDLVEWNGAPHVMELELIEPYLFLEADSPELARFASAIAERL